MNNGSSDQTVQIERPDEMGKVFTTLTIANRADQILAEAGVILEGDVRSITLNNDKLHASGRAIGRTK